VRRARANRRLPQLNFALFTELASDQDSVFSVGSAVSLLPPSIVPAMNQANEGQVAEIKSKVEPEGSLGSNNSVGIGSPVAAAAGSTHSSLPSSLSWVVHRTPDAVAEPDNDDDDNDDWEMLGDDADSVISVRSNFVLSYADAVQFRTNRTPKDAPASCKADEEALSVRIMDTKAQIDTFIEWEARPEPRGRKGGRRRDGKQRWKRY